jgi:hypothetical protein
MSIEIKQQEGQDKENENQEVQYWIPKYDSNAYTLFLYALRSPITRDYYLRRLRIFLNYINLLPEETMENRCNSFALKAREDPNWLFNCIITFLQFQRDRVERKEIVAATLKNFLKPLKLFCEMSDISIAWKIITRVM